MSKFRKIYLDIESKIKENIYPPGTLLPSENEMSQTYNVSRETIRRALQQLSDNGFIYKKQGVGSTVLDYQRFALPINGLVSYKEINEQYNLNCITKVIRNEIIPAPQFIVEQTEIEPEETMIYLVRTREYSKNEIIIIDEDYIRTNIVSHIPEGVGEESIYQYFEEDLNLEIGYALKEITGEKATPLDIQYMGIGPDDSTITVTSQVFLKDMTFFQYTISHHRLDRFRFQEFAPRHLNIAK